MISAKREKRETNCRLPSDMHTGHFGIDRVLSNARSQGVTHGIRKCYWHSLHSAIRRQSALPALCYAAI